MIDNRIIIDVTQLVHWQGELTGIPRVIDEISKRYIGNPQAFFTTWDKQSNNYLEIDLERTNQIRGQGICYIKRDGTTFDPTASQSRRIAQQAAKNSMAAMPVKVLKKLHHKLRSPKANSNSYRTITPHKGDTVLVIWGEWQDSTFIDGLKRAHTNGANLVQVVHDMLPIIAPQYSGSGNATQTMAIYNQELLPICSLILAVSNNTKKDVEQWLAVNKLYTPAIKVIRNGDDLSAHTPKIPHELVFQNSKLVGKDFILCVGTIEARKNHTLLYYIWKLAQSKNTKLPKLVIVGRLGWHTENIYEIMTTDPEVKDKFIFLHEVTDDELEWLYQHCLFSIYPSFYEGWGIPIAESARRGVPVIASNTSSMPEIAGNLINYFSPFSASEALDSILKLNNEEQLKKAKKLLLQYKPTNWNDTFRQVDNYLKELQ